MALDRGKLERRTKEVDLATQKFIVGMKVLAPVMRNILPRTLSDAMYGRQSARCAKTRQFFLRYTDRWSRLPYEELAIEILRINRFMQLQLIRKATVKDPVSSDDDPIFILYHSTAPEIMLDVVKFTSDPEFALGGQIPNFLNYLAIENLTSFLYKGMPTQPYLSEKLFRDLNPELKELLVVLSDDQKWFEAMAIVRMMGIASFSPCCYHWLQKNGDIFEVICRYMYRAPEIIEEKIKAGEVVAKRKDDISMHLLLYRNWDDPVAVARLVGTLTCSHAVFAFYNTMKWSMTDYDVYARHSIVFRRAEVFTHFFRITKQLMIWPNAGQFLNYFVFGIRRCLDMDGAVNDLFIKGLSNSRKHNTPRGIESLKYWSHATIRPTTLGWIVCHALSLNEVFGACACIQILTHVLVNFRNPVVSTVIESIGAELMDLAHLVKFTSALKDEVAVQEIPVQTPILEALLRYAGVSHTVHGQGDTFEGTMKPPGEMPDYCLEAALFCRRAALEAVMTITEKQRRVSQADAKKQQGNMAFKAGNYKEAIELYSDALALCPLSARPKQALYYSNRAECYLRCNEPSKAIHDCNRSLCLEKSCMVKVQWRRSRAYQKLNLAYPAWIDMKCIEDEWSLTREQTRVDFHQLLSELSEEVGVFKKDLLSDLDRRIFASYTIAPASK